MPKINVAKAFRLNMADSTSKHFDVGEHNVDKETADHWFVKANLVGATYEPKVGSYEYALRGRTQKSEEEVAAAEQEAEAAAQAKAEAGARAADLMEKTSQTIAVVAQQAQDNATKKDQQAEGVTTDLPQIPLNAAPSVPSAEQEAEAEQKAE